MKLSRKPKNLLVMLLIAVFLMSFAGIGMAATTVDWSGLSKIHRSDSAIKGTITESVYQNVYATVYAQIGGESLTDAIITQECVYGGASFSIPLSSFKTLSNNKEYNVSLLVYSASTPGGIKLADKPTTYTSKDKFTYVLVTGSSGGGGGGGGAVIPPTGSTPPSVNATFGTAVSITSSKGATVNASGVTVTIPANALASDIKVTITKVAETAGLKLDAGSKLISDVLEIIKDKSGNFSKPVTISLSFDKSKVDTNKFDLKVCYYDEDNDKWVPLDNVSMDLANGKISGDTTHFTKFAVIAFPKEAKKPDTKTPAGLSDIAGHWAEASIKQLVASGAISGYPNGTFKPNNSITRAEFATVVVKAFKLNAANGKVFADTSNHWAKSYIATAEAAGIVSGYGNNKFGPDDLITREQMAVMIVKAANLTGGNGKTFTDSAKIAPWAKSAVSTANATGVISGFPDGSFKPQDKATRAQAVTVIVNALK